MINKKLNISLNSEICLKGILAILIIFSHSLLAEEMRIGQYTFNNLNYYFVAIYFFLSGFGLSLKKNERKEFNIIKKSLSLIIPYYIVCFIYVIFFDKNLDIQNIFNIIFFNKIIPYCWYVKTQLLLYITWWININIVKQYNISYEYVNYLFIFIVLIYYSINQHYNLITSTTYITVFNFLAGIIYANEVYEKCGTKFVIISEILLFILSIIFFVFFPREEKLISYILINISTCCFSIFVIQLLYFVKINNYALLFLGKISYYIYISQCIAQCMFQKTYFCKTTYFNLDNKYLILLYTIIIDFIISCLLKIIIDMLFKNKIERKLKK